MKKVFLSIIFMVMVLANLSAYAHPPSDIIISYDTQTKVLHAVIMHNTMNTVKHYIKQVEVALNDKVIITQMFSLQGNNVSQDVTYLVPDAKAGDKLSVDADCNLSGDLKKAITVK